MIESLVFSVVHPKKFGLYDIARALSLFGNTIDASRLYTEISGLGEMLKVCLARSRVNRSRHFVFWDNSVFSMVMMLIARASNGSTYYYLHEPGGLGQKLVKGDGLLYSILASIAESLMMLIANMTLVPSPDKLVFGDKFAPLLFIESSSPEPIRGDKTFVGFLGARRRSRLHHVFSEVSEHLCNAGYPTAYFPSEEHGYSGADKLVFLRHCKAVWNVYGVPYNQSGVTGDCIMNRVRCVVSKHEPYRATLDALGLCIEIDMRQSPEQIADVIIGSIAVSQKPDDNGEAAKAASEFGGAEAFRRYWLPLFDQ